MIIGQWGRVVSLPSRQARWAEAISSSAVSSVSARARWTGSGSSPSTTCTLWP
jgi:hypothetical protein